MRNGKLKVRITKCYLVEVIDKDGFVQYWDEHGTNRTADDYCFGTKEDAKLVGEDLMRLVEESRNRGE